MWKIANMLIDKNCSSQNIPYMDKAIDLTDNYKINREKILTIKQKIFRKIWVKWLFIILILYNSMATIIKNNIKTYSGNFK